MGQTQITNDSRSAGALRPDGLESVARHHGKLLEAQARRLTRDPGSAADLVQDAFERALRQAPDIDAQRLCRWILVIMRNLAIDQLRRRRAYRFALDRISKEPAPVHVNPHAHGAGPDADEHRVEQVRRAAASLAAPLRQVFELHLGESSLDEIASAMHIPRATVGTRLFRARGQLRELLADLEAESGKRGPG